MKRKKLLLILSIVLVFFPALLLWNWICRMTFVTPPAFFTILDVSKPWRMHYVDPDGSFASLHMKVDGRIDGDAIISASDIKFNLVSGMFHQAESIQEYWGHEVELSYIPVNVKSGFVNVCVDIR